LACFASSHLHYDIERQKDEAIATKEPTLAEMVDWGIKTLSQNPKGYLLVIESGRIDHAGHENNFQKQVHDTIALDAAYKVAFEGSDSETLIVSTSDHETGGLALSGYGDVKKIKGDNFLAVQEDKTLVTWATGPGVSSNDKGIEKKEKSVYYKEFANHSAVDVLILAKGPSQNLFAGFMKNSMIPIKILEAMGLKFDDSATVENQKSQANLK
jgi:alkaline phosphatase